ncbi:MAG TPA: chemotaxis protein CheR [Gammaproteobacteria bacterium]|nr:chemotaxis protein CheR [Gammaproteobacteria bacterium]
MNISGYGFNDYEFSQYQALIAAHTGIAIADNKKELVYGRVSRRIRELGLSSFADYRKELEKGSKEELEKFSNLITTNLTSFFREEHHFDYLRDTLVPELMRSRASSRKIRVWSAGCSSGEEPYSIAISMLEASPALKSWDLKILATDLDSAMVAQARQGVYRLDRLAGMKKHRLLRWFQKGQGRNEGMVRVNDELREIITFNRLNLMESWPMQGLFDIIFCRNVVIYFDQATQTKLFSRFANQMPDDGTLFVGHSESLSKVTDKFRLLEKTIYKKV